MKTTNAVLRDIHQHGEATYPEECCGFLLGTAGEENHVTALHQVPNRQDDQRTHRYTITPADYRNADEAASAKGLDIVGMYHSHPDHPAWPSETDLAEATFPGYTYVIVAVREGVATDLTAWTLAPDRSSFLKQPISAESPAASA